jgi:hypothetical protein
MESAAAENRRLIAALLLGALAFAAGLALAYTYLPEWRDSTWLSEEVLTRRFQELAVRAGVRLEPGAPKVTPTTESELSDIYGTWKKGDGWRFVPPPTPVHVSVRQSSRLPGREQVKELEIRFSPDGRPVYAAWGLTGLQVVIPSLADPPVSPETTRALMGLLLAPGESLGRAYKGSFSGNPADFYEIQGAVPGGAPSSLFVLSPLGGRVQVERTLGSAAAGAAESEGIWSRLFFKGLPHLIAFLAVVGLFIVLLSKGRIDLINGALLAVLAFAVGAVTAVGGEAVETLLSALVTALWIFFLWSAGESFLRSIDEGFTTSLDALRAGRLGPRGGRSILYGFALGAILAGLKLALRALALAAPGTWPFGTSLPLPVFSGDQNPLADGISQAAAVLFLLAIALRLLHRRWAAPLAALAGAYFFHLVGLHPMTLQLAVGFFLYWGLFWVYRRYGMTALLVTSVVSFLLPATVFAAVHADWLPVTCAATVGLSIGLLALGFVGLSRPERVELERLTPPRFIRRLEEERRLKYEMDLLARMQLGLLPTDVPAVPGWDIAARSLLATEAGGDLYDFILDDAGDLWIAAGDVAGHGYSCAIVQAMTTAALTSLIAPGKSPSEVLVGVDRVIRRGGTRRNFTSLTLLRIDPLTGEAVLANAGHPYPLALADGEVAELAVPGLPLGQGPRRQYLDIPLQIPEGGALVLCSDGLYEAVNWESSPYGFDRPREVLRTLETRTAEEILETLLADWRSHVRSEAPPDDTTIVVIKRATAFDRSITVA